MSPDPNPNLTELRRQVVAMQSTGASLLSRGTLARRALDRLEADLAAPPEPEPPAPQPPAPRDPHLAPFSHRSFDLVPLGSGTRYEAATDTRTAALLKGNPEVNSGRWSIAIARATETDPLATITDTGKTPAVTARYRVPAGLEATAGQDRHVGVVQPDGHTLVEIYAYQRVSTTAVSSTYVNVTDLRTSGLLAGSRASGISFLHGLIRTHELADLTIPHALALGIPQTMLKLVPDTTDGLVVPANSGGAAVWPARLIDTQHANMRYRGPIAMGTMVAIPPEIDLTGLGLSPEGLAAGRALQDRGACVVVQSDTVALYVEPNANTAAVARLRADWARALFPRLRRITTNHPGTLDQRRDPVNLDGLWGGGTRRAALATPLT